MDKKIKIEISSDLAGLIVEAIEEYFFLNEYSTYELEAFYEKLKNEVGNG